MSDPQPPSVAPVAEDEVLFFQRVLVPLDFSEHARRALRHARGLVRQYRARLMLLHVVEPMACPSDLGYTPVITDEMVEEIRREAGARLEEAVAGEKARGIECEGLLRFGRPYLEITEAADEAGADLIVLTTHGYTGLKHVVLGSTAERVVRHARCPVLVVREKGGTRPLPPVLHQPRAERAICLGERRGTQTRWPLPAAPMLLHDPPSLRMGRERGLLTAVLALQLSGLRRG